MSDIDKILIALLATGKVKNGSVIDAAELFDYLTPDQVTSVAYLRDGHVYAAQPARGIYHKWSLRWKLPWPRLWIDSLRWSWWRLRWLKVIADHLGTSTKLIVWYPAKRTPHRAVKDSVVELKRSRSQVKS